MTKCSPHGWTLDTLERFLSREIKGLRRVIAEHEKHNRERFENAKESVGNALAAADKATNKAEMASNTRFEGVNEFRKTLSDQANMLMPRAEYSAQHQSVIDKIDSLTVRVAAIEATTKGKSEGLGTLGQIALGLIAVGAMLVSLVTLIVLFFRHT